jgi:hypothetical protein
MNRMLRWIGGFFVVVAGAVAVPAVAQADGHACPAINGYKPSTNRCITYRALRGENYHNIRTINKTVTYWIIVTGGAGLWGDEGPIQHTHCRWVHWKKNTAECFPAFLTDVGYPGTGDPLDPNCWAQPNIYYVNGVPESTSYTCAEAVPINQDPVIATDSDGGRVITLSDLD